MALSHAVGLPPEIDFPLRAAAAALLILFVSRPYLHVRPSRPMASILIGIAVFVIWVGPDVLFGPGYRRFWLFQNALFGQITPQIDENLRQNTSFLAFRGAISFLLVPVLEELFWRGWLMRWLIKPEFRAIPFGTYAASAFWIVAVLFASEHGPFWEVGLAAGIIYNWWAVKTKCLADCILAHAVTNAILSGYVLIAGAWQYWL